MLKNKPSKKKPIESAPQRIHRASLTVISHKIPSKLNSKIKPNGAEKDLQKKEKKSASQQSQNMQAVKPKAPSVPTMADTRVIEEGK